MVVKIKKILLTFDVEEFDLPLEYNKNISEQDQYDISKRGTEIILEFLEKNNIKATFFISAKFAKQYPNLIKNISKKHEIGLHCYEHKDNYQKMDEKETFERLKNGKEIIEKIINKKIKGFRAPRFQPPSYKILNKLEIIYDSSLHPTFIPGRYNHFFEVRKVHNKNGVNILPITVSPILRLPIFWLAFRNLQLIYSKYITNRNKEYICLVFHSWEFVNIEHMDLPKLIKRNTGDKLINKLQDYINNYKRYDFTTISSYLFTS